MKRHGFSVCSPVMETIAITSWNNIISPLYDASCCLQIIRPDGVRSEADVREMNLFEKADLVSREGVEILICGAISNLACRFLQDRGVRVLPWISGPVDAVLDAYVNNVNLAINYAMPGCRRMICRQGGQHRNRHRRMR